MFDPCQRDPADGLRCRRTRAVSSVALQIEEAMAPRTRDRTAYRGTTHVQAVETMAPSYRIAHRASPRSIISSAVVFIRQSKMLFRGHGVHFPLFNQDASTCSVIAAPRKNVVPINVRMIARSIFMRFSLPQPATPDDLARAPFRPWGLDNPCWLRDVFNPPSSRPVTCLGSSAPVKREALRQAAPINPDRAPLPSEATEPDRVPVPARALETHPVIRVPSMFFHGTVRHRKNDPFLIVTSLPAVSDAS